MRINETPVRTANNFNINNISLDNIEFPSNITDFNDLKIICNDTKVSIGNSTSKICLTYGLGDELTSLVREKSNSRVNININSKTNKEVCMSYSLDENNVLIEDIEITANEGTKETVIIKYESNNFAFHDGIIRINAKKNSYLNIIVVNLLDKSSNNFLSIQNNMEENSNVKFTMVDLGAQNSITNYYSNMNGDFAKNYVSAIYLGDGMQMLDLNYIAELSGKNSNIKIDIQGALSDFAKKHFKGTIDFKKGCKKSVGDENESCMLLSDKAKSISLPMLLCSEEDVEGNHSCSAGRIDDKELFYIMSRGFSLKEALKLMVKTKFNKILETIPNEDLTNEIINDIDKRFD